MTMSAEWLIVSARIRDSECEQLDAVARAKGITRSAYLRDLIQRGVEQGRRDLMGDPNAFARYIGALGSKAAK